MQPNSYSMIYFGMTVEWKKALDTIFTRSFSARVYNLAWYGAFHAGYEVGIMDENMDVLPTTGYKDQYRHIPPVTIERFASGGFEAFQQVILYDPDDVTSKMREGTLKKAYDLIPNPPDPVSPSGNR
jgi:hypothetical protein